MERIELDNRIEAGKLDYMFAKGDYHDWGGHRFQPERLVITIYDTAIVTIESKDAYFKRISEFQELGANPDIAPKEIYRSLKVKEQNGDILLETGEIMCKGDSSYRKEKHFLVLVTGLSKKSRVFVYVPARKYSEDEAVKLAKEAAESLLISAEARKQYFEYLAYFIKYGRAEKLKKIMARNIETINKKLQKINFPPISFDFDKWEGEIKSHRGCVYGVVYQGKLTYSWDEDYRFCLVAHLGSLPVSSKYPELDWKIKHYFLKNGEINWRRCGTLWAQEFVPVFIKGHDEPGMKYYFFESGSRPLSEDSKYYSDESIDLQGYYNDIQKTRDFLAKRCKGFNREPD
ncbi:MAG: hypothetical protein ABIH22_01320 [Candidatus Margulisiibacteriota bacterium]